MRMTKITLYQFPLSHYCEKVRWTLDYKKIPFQTQNLVPGPHLLVTKKLAPKTSVPILVEDKTIVQDSTDILDYLEEKYPGPSLTPSSPNLQKEALELEEYFDKHIGSHLRRLLYFHLLEDRPLVTSLLLQNSPWYGPPLYKVAFPVVRKLMKKTMNITPEATQKSVKILDEALEMLNKRIKENKFLVGNKFSRADLTAASLLAPLCNPLEHDFEWPEISNMPLEIQKYRLMKEKEPFFDWVLEIYHDHR